MWTVQFSIPSLQNWADPKLSNSAQMIQRYLPFAVVVSLYVPLLDESPISPSLLLSADQCDQIWQNFATLAKIYKSLANC